MYRMRPTLTVCGPQLNRKATDHYTAMRLLVHSTLAVDGRAVTFGTARRGLGGSPLAVPHVTARPSTASVPTSDSMPH